jgi:hypothetical protein
MKKSSTYIAQVTEPAQSATEEDEEMAGSGRFSN